MPAIEPISHRNIAAVVDVHLDAFTGYMNASMGRDYVRRFLLWFADRSDAIALAAVDDDRIVGYVVGAPVGYERALSRDLSWPVVRAIAVRPWLLLRGNFRRRLLQRAVALFRTRPALASVPSIPGPVMSLVGIGVAAAGRGTGVGRLLMDEFERRCRAQNVKAMRLSVYADNRTARALYERAGWTLFVPDGDASAVYYYRVI